MAGRIVAENRALALRPHILYLPRTYAALLVSVSGIIGLGYGYPVAGAWLFAFGWVLGKVVTLHDPFAWELMARNLTLPRVLRP